MTVGLSQPLKNQAMTEGLLFTFRVLDVQVWLQGQLLTLLQLAFRFFSITQLSNSLILVVFVAFQRDYYFQSLLTFVWRRVPFQGMPTTASVQVWESFLKLIDVSLQFLCILEVTYLSAQFVVERWHFAFWVRMQWLHSQFSSLLLDSHSSRQKLCAWAYVLQAIFEET